MNDAEAIRIVRHYAGAAGVPLTGATPVRRLRTLLAKAYQPRQVGDDETAMRRINPAVEHLEDAAFASLSDIPAFAGRLVPPPPNQPPPQESAATGRQDFTDADFLRTTIAARAARYGRVQPVVAKVWLGDGWGEPLTLDANRFAFSDLGGAVSQWQSARTPGRKLQGVFVAVAGTPDLQLIRLRVGRAFEDVSSYGLRVDPDTDPTVGLHGIAGWLDQVRRRIDDEWRTA